MTVLIFFLCGRGFWRQDPGDTVIGHTFFLEALFDVHFLVYFFASKLLKFSRREHLRARKLWKQTNKNVNEICTNLNIFRSWLPEFKVCRENGCRFQWRLKSGLQKGDDLKLKTEESEGGPDKSQMGICSRQTLFLRLCLQHFFSNLIPHFFCVVIKNGVVITGF